MHDTPRWPITVPTASFVWAKDWTGSQDGKGNLAALCLGWAHPIPATLFVQHQLWAAGTGPPAQDWPPWRGSQ